MSEKMIPNQYETYEIKSVNDFLEHLPESPVEYPWGYRGHASCEWKLIPTLFRDLVDLEDITDPFQKALALRGLEKSLLNNFKAYARPHIAIEPSCDLAWLAFAQHYGLPTRLLDWTENPLVAMFFALKDQSEHDAVIWALLVPSPSLKETEFTLDILDDELLLRRDGDDLDASQSTHSWSSPIYRYHPSQTTNRITAQQGFFTIQGFWGQSIGELHLLPLEEQFGLELYSLGASVMDDPLGPWFRKYTISSDYKSTIRKQLDVLGMNHYSIFPDLEGIAKKLREDVKLKKRF